jgi:hypothetical protein
MGLDLSIATKFKALLDTAGFAHVTEEIFDLPIGDWMEDNPRMKEVGLLQRWQMVEGVQGMAAGLLTRVGGWGIGEVEEFLVGVRREMKDKEVRCLYKL